MLTVHHLSIRFARPVWSLNELPDCCSRKRFSPGVAGMGEKLRRYEDTINIFDLKDSIRLYVYISPAISLIHELHWRYRIFFRGFVHDFTSINMSIRGLSHQILIWYLRNFYLKEIDLWRKLPRVKKNLKLVKKYIQIFRGVLSNFLILQKLCYLQNWKVARNVFKKFRRLFWVILRTSYS